MANSLGHSNSTSMKQTIYALLFLFFHTACWQHVAAQNCNLKPPAIKIDFGSRSKSSGVNLSALQNYEQVNGLCPQDGHYSFVSSTTDCFNGHWVIMDHDHTPGDSDGKMLLVNSSYPPGLFFIVNIDGLLPNRRYELGAWLVNVCRPEFECTGIRPNLRFIVETTAGKELARFGTGYIIPTGMGTWLNYAAFFTTPATGGRLVLKIENTSEGGCGNDFALDDITFRECVVTKPEQRSEAKPLPPATAVVKSPATKKAVVKQQQSLPKTIKKDEPALSKLPVTTPTEKVKVSKASPAFAPVPAVILSRENPVVKHIETSSGELVIDLYDNGVIDGDTVTIYHNNQMIVSRALLSAKPISIRIPVDVKDPHHELVMVANNLGSIPPNTSLMVVTDKNKRYEVFISSSEQKNAKVVIDLKE